MHSLSAASRYNLLARCNFDVLAGARARSALYPSSFATSSYLFSPLSFPTSAYTTRCLHSSAKSSKKTPQEESKKLAEEIPKKAPKEATKKTPKNQTSEKTHKGVPKEITKKASKGAPEKTPKDTPKKTLTKQTSKKTPKEIPKKAPKGTSEKTTKEILSKKSAEQPSGKPFGKSSVKTKIAIVKTSVRVRTSSKLKSGDTKDNTPSQTTDLVIEKLDVQTKMKSEKKVDNTPKKTRAKKQEEEQELAESQESGPILTDATDKSVFEPIVEREIDIGKSGNKIEPKIEPKTEPKIQGDNSIEITKKEKKLTKEDLEEEEKKRKEKERNPLGVTFIRTETPPKGVTLPPVTLGDVVEHFSGGKAKLRPIIGFITARHFHIECLKLAVPIHRSAITFRFPLGSVEIKDGDFKFTSDDILSLTQKTESLITTEAESRIEILWRHKIKQPSLYVTPLEALPILFGQDYLEKCGKSQTFEYEGKIVPIFHLHAATQILSNDHIYFSLCEPGLFMCKSPERVSELRKMRYMLENLEYTTHFLQAAERTLILHPKYRSIYLNSARKVHFSDHNQIPVSQNAVTTPCTNWDVSSYKYCISAIQQAATEERSKPVDEYLLKKIMVPLGFHFNPVNAHQMLVMLGIWGDTENLHAMGARYNTDLLKNFPDQIVQAANEVSQKPDKDAEKRKDFRNLRVFTIDSPTTVEIDDGLSLEYRSDGTEWIHVHISDPTRWIEAWSVLDIFARKKISTVYLPEHVSHLFPLSLSRDVMSILPGEESCTVTFSAKLGEDGSLQDYEIAPSTIQQTQRTNYEEIDELLNKGKSPVFDLEASYTLHRLYEFALRRSQYRQNLGSTLLNIPKMEVHLLDQDIDLGFARDLSSKSQTLVSEMMVLAGQVAATYATKHNIPVPFRTQLPPEYPTPDYPEFINSLPPVVREFMMVSVRTMASYSAVHKRHDGVGLDAYTRATSPLRRYGDLLVHWQIKAHLRGEKLPFTDEQIDEISEKMYLIERDIKRLQTSSQRFYILQYLKQSNIPHPGLVLEIRKSGTRTDAIIFLMDIGLNGTLPGVPVTLKRGDKVEVYPLQVGIYSASFKLANTQLPHKKEKEEGKETDKDKDKDKEEDQIPDQIPDLLET